MMKLSSVRPLYAYYAYFPIQYIFQKNQEDHEDRLAEAERHRIHKLCLQGQASLNAFKEIRTNDVTRKIDKVTYKLELYTHLP